MAEHTKEPWGFDTNKRAIGIFSGDELIAEINADDEPAKVDARRIVSCVNAMQGIPDPVAYVKVMGEVVEALEVVGMSAAWHELSEESKELVHSALVTARAQMGGGHERRA